MLHAPRILAGTVTPASSKQKLIDLAVGAGFTALAVLFSALLRIWSLGHRRHRVPRTTARSRLPRKLRAARQKAPVTF